MFRATILVSYVICASIPAGADEISILDVVEKFPICDIPSSLGQKCKYELKNRNQQIFSKFAAQKAEKLALSKMLQLS